MKHAVFRGAATALITPMLPDGKVDLAGMRQLVSWQIRSGIDALVICGTTGECATLSQTEHLQVLEAAVQEADGRVPIIAGTGSNDTAFSVQTSREAAKIGADALLSVTPYYNKTTQEGLLRHFTAIAESADLPMILYNVPSRTGMDISLATCRRLSSHPLMAGIKEASGDMGKALRIIEACGDDLPLYTGNDDLTLPTLACGGYGVISVLSNLLPKQMATVCKAAFQGDFACCRKDFLPLLPLIGLLFEEVNPIPVKKAMALKGHPSGPLRLPLVQCSGKLEEKLRAEMKKLELLP